MGVEKELGTTIGRTYSDHVNVAYAREQGGDDTQLRDLAPVNR